MYSKAGSRVIGQSRPGTYPPSTMTQIRSFVKGSELHRNLGGLRFEQVGKQLQVARRRLGLRAALVDLDNDGWLDICTPRPATSVATGMSRTAETASGWLSCHSLAIVRHASPLPGKSISL